MSLFTPVGSSDRRRVPYVLGVVALLFLIGLGVFARNGWLPQTDGMTGKRTGWFGRDVSSPHVSKGSPDERSSWWPFSPVPTPTPQLSREYVYAG